MDTKSPCPPVKKHLIGRTLKIFGIMVLILIVIIEGYYIWVLRNNIVRHNEDMHNISMQLQQLRNEKKNLDEELSAMKKTQGEDRNGNTAER